jgi:hypothetical protein
MLQKKSRAAAAAAAAAHHDTQKEKVRKMMPPAQPRWPAKSWGKQQQCVLVASRTCKLI